MTGHPLSGEAVRHIGTARRTLAGLRAELLAAVADIDAVTPHPKPDRYLGDAEGPVPGAAAWHTDWKCSLYDRDQVAVLLADDDDTAVGPTVWLTGLTGQYDIDALTLDDAARLGHALLAAVAMARAGQAPTTRGRLPRWR